MSDVGYDTINLVSSIQVLTRCGQKSRILVALLGGCSISLDTVLLGLLSYYYSKDTLS